MKQNASTRSMKKMAGAVRDAFLNKYADRSEDHFHNKPVDVLRIGATYRLHGVHPNLRKYRGLTHQITLDFLDHKVRT